MSILVEYFFFFFREKCQRCRRQERRRLTEEPGQCVVAKPVEEAMEGWGSHRKQKPPVDNSVSLGIVKGSSGEEPSSERSPNSCSLLLLRWSFLAASAPRLFFLMNGCLR